MRRPVLAARIIFKIGEVLEIAVWDKWQVTAPLGEIGRSRLSRVAKRIPGCA
jgi:hypothetical protein